MSELKKKVDVIQDTEPVLKKLNRLDDIIEKVQSVETSVKI